MGWMLPMTDQSIAADADTPPREYGPLCNWVGRKVAHHLQALEPAVYAKEIAEEDNVKVVDYKAVLDALGRVSTPANDTAAADRTKELLG